MLESPGGLPQSIAFDRWFLDRLCYHHRHIPVTHHGDRFDQPKVTCVEGSSDLNERCQPTNSSLIDEIEVGEPRMLDVRHRGPVVTRRTRRDHPIVVGKRRDNRFKNHIVGLAVVVTTAPGVSSVMEQSRGNRETTVLLQQSEVVVEAIEQISGKPPGADTVFDIIQLDVRAAKQGVDIGPGCHLGAQSCLSISSSQAGRSYESVPDGRDDDVRAY